MDYGKSSVFTKRREYTRNARKITAGGTKYDGATEEELIKAIVLEAEKGRRNGSLTDADIDRFVSMLAPMLDDKKRKKLYAIAEKIKKK